MTELARHSSIVIMPTPTPPHVALGAVVVAVAVAVEARIKDDIARCIAHDRDRAIVTMPPHARRMGTSSAIAIVHAHAHAAHSRATLLLAPTAGRLNRRQSFLSSST